MSQTQFRMLVVAGGVLSLILIALTLRQGRHNEVLLQAQFREHIEDICWGCHPHRNLYKDPT